MVHTCVLRLLPVLHMVLLLAPLGIARANVSLPVVFGHHMVLQRDLPIRVWGKALPSEKITVTFAGKTLSTEGDASGQWEVKLPAMHANAKGQTMTITGNNTIVINDILIGEVWVCSGQSNMEFLLVMANNGQAEVAAANYPDIRLFNVTKNTSAVPLNDCNASWNVCTPKFARDFTAVGYFFGRELYKHLNVPVGLIETSWGGTVAETWTSHQALRAAMPDFNDAIDKINSTQANEESKVAQYKLAMKDYQKSLNQANNLQDDKKTALAFADPARDTSDWKSMQAPGNWEKNGYPDMNGILWYRKTIDVPATWVGKDLVLNLGPIDEVDQTFFNGTFIDGKGNIRTGDVSYWDQPRTYTVPGKHVKAGKNLIAIRVFDIAGQGGLWGADASGMFATLANGTTDQSIPLAGTWFTFAEYQIIPKPANPYRPNRPGILFNAMLNPIIGYGIRGAIWYQGESNASRAAQYRTLMPTLIKDWRDRWQQGNFPFLIVSLANYMERKDQPEQSAWAELREAQYLTAANDPNTGLAIIIDLGEAKNVHPKNKQDVGYRLSLQARKIAYNEILVADSPTFKSMNIDGNKAVLTFDHVGKGLIAIGDKLTGFAIAGNDGKFVWANAAIQGKNQIIVSAEKVSTPTAVRYAWANNPECNLHNSADLPAIPFRTDAPQ